MWQVANIEFKKDDRFVMITCKQCNRLLFSGDCILLRGDMSLAQFLGAVWDFRLHSPGCLNR